MKSKAWLPTPGQVLLLKSAFLHKTAAAEAWNRWNESGNLENLDRPSKRLIPLVTDRIRRITESGITQKMSGFRRKCWFQNQVLINKALKMVRLFVYSGIPVAVLKGTAFLNLYYKDWSLRPMEDVDLLVPPDLSARAADILEKNGWKSKTAVKCPFDDYYRLTYHARGFHSSSGGQIDLHWNVLRNCFTGDLFRTHAVPMKINGESVLTLCTGDHLLHILEHGAHRKNVPQARWAADALMLLKTASDFINWNHFLDQTHNAGLTITVREMLVYLRDIFKAPIPEAVTANLFKHPPKKIDLALSHTMHKGKMGRWPFIMLFRFSKNLRSVENLKITGFSIPGLFFRFLRVRWNLACFHRIPLTLIKKILKKFQVKKMLP